MRRPLSFFLLLAVLTSANWIDFLIGARSLRHDSLHILIFAHPFFDELFRGQLPLWSAATHGGHPLWSTTEMAPLFDPILMLSWLIGFIFKTSSLAPLTWACFGWLTIFSASAMRCAKRIIDDWPMNLAVFAVLFAGPIAVASASQAHGYLLPFRYTPLVILAFLRLEEVPSLKRAIFLGLTLAASYGGYQSPYHFGFLGFFFLVYFVAKRVQRSPIHASFRHHCLVALGIGFLGMAPNLILGPAWMGLVPMARQVDSAYFFGLDFFAMGISDVGHHVDSEHGSSYLGILMWALILFPFLRWGAGLLEHLSDPAKERNGLKFSPLEIAWSVSGVVFFLLCVRGYYLLPRDTMHFAFVRNWGFTLTCVLLCGSQLAMTGFRHFREFTEKRPSRAFLGHALVLTLFIWNGICLRLYMDYWRYHAVLNVLALPVVILLLFHLRGVEKKKWLSPIFLLICVADTVAFAHFARRAYPLRPTAAMFRTKAPLLGNHFGGYAPFREWRADNLSYHPFHFGVPMLFRRAFATSQDQVGAAGLGSGSGVTEVFRLPRYDRLLNSGLEENLLKQILGVSLPILRTVRRVSFVENEEQARASLLKLPPGASLADYAVIEGRPQGSPPILSAASSSADKVTVTAYDRGELTAEVTMAEEGWLIYSDSFDAGWEAIVDESPTALRAADGVSKAVLVPVGKHTVRFTYRPLSYLFAFWTRVGFWSMAAIYLLVSCLSSIAHDNRSLTRLRLSETGWSQG